jgi:hypothetical protein
VSGYGKGQDFQGAASAAPVQELSWLVGRAPCLCACMLGCLVVVGAFAHEKMCKGTLFIGQDIYLAKSYLCYRPRQSLLDWTWVPLWPESVLAWVLLGALTLSMHLFILF